MNSRHRATYSLLVLLSLAACGTAVERRTYHVDRRFPAAAIRRIEVREIDGTISIDGDSTEEITLGAVVKSREAPRANQDNQGYFRTEVVGDTLVIGRRQERRHRGIHLRIPFIVGEDTRVDYELHVPAGVAIDLSTVNGRITTHGIEGQTRATTVNGIVNINSPGSSEVEAKAVNGRVEATFLNDFHGASLRTVNGRVIAVLPPTASFVSDFSQVNGDVEAAFPLNIHSHPGSRRVSGEVNGGRYSLHISTVNGDIKIENSGQPPIPPVAPAPPPAPVGAAPAAPATPQAPVAASART